MNATVIPFPSRRPIVFIDPVPDDGGSWGVFFQHQGHAAEKVGALLWFDHAEAAAREIAKRVGADFLDDMAPEPTGAA